MMVEVKYSRFGLASRSGDLVILHEGLRDPRFKALHDRLLRHELEHSDGSEDVWHDLKHDLRDSLDWSFHWDLFKYALVRPGTWWAYSPVRPFNGKVGVDVVHGIIATFILGALFLAGIVILVMK